MAEIGLFGQMPLHSHTSQYGQFSRMEKLDKGFIRKALEEAYEYIENGGFAREWKAERENGMPEFKRLREEANRSEIIQVEGKLIRSSI